MKDETGHPGVRTGCKNSGLVEPINALEGLRTTAPYAIGTSAACGSAPTSPGDGGSTRGPLLHLVGPLFGGRHGHHPRRCLLKLGLVIALVVALGRLSSIRVVAMDRRGLHLKACIRGRRCWCNCSSSLSEDAPARIVIDPFPAVIAFSLNAGGCRRSNPGAIRGAARAGAASTIGERGYTLTLRRVALPQALRVAVPPPSNTSISLVKDTLASDHGHRTAAARPGDRGASYAFLKQPRWPRSSTG